MLDELVDVIEALKSRINDHRAVLQGSEAQTRMSLIDPLLRALEWDTADPDSVRPEYVVGGRRADYALMNAQGEVVVFLEAKNLGEQLANHRSQVVAYASELGIRFPALTNGNEWEVYDNSQLVPIEQRRVLNLSIANLPAHQNALQFLLLWRPNMASGHPIEASEPILGTGPAAAAIATPAETSAPTVPDEDWITLRNLRPEAGTRPPTEVQLPNGETKQLTTWKSLLLEIAEWLIRDGVLTAAKCPIPGGQSTAHYSINTQPEHANGAKFFAPENLSNGLLLIATGSSQAITSRCRAIMEYLGKDPATVHVQVV